MKRRESYSDRWIDAARKQGHEVKIVDVWRSDVLDQLRDCDGFMWRFLHPIFYRRLAHRLLPAIEKQLGLLVFPDWRTAWHYDDKISQFYLLTAAGIPVPKTWVFWSFDDACEFARTAQYPLVLKLSGGASAENVRLARTYDEALYWIGILFDLGIEGLGDLYGPAWPLLSRIKGAGKLLLKGQPPRDKSRDRVVELHNNYFLAQEFLQGNAFDNRVTVVGNRAFAYRRFNRPDDFRASGSGNFDVDPEQVDMECVRLAFRTARALGTQSIAIDGLRRGEERVVGEISYTYVSWMVQSCPGHWELNGEPETGELVWCEGQMWPEDAIMSDFLVELASRQREQ